MRAFEIISNRVTQLRRLLWPDDFKPYWTNRDHDGLSFSFLIGDTDGQEWYGTNQSRPEMTFLRDVFLDPNDIVFEVGAHHGLHTVMLGMWLTPNGKVIAFEPNPANAHIIEQNIIANEITNVQLERLAVGAATGELKFFKRSNGMVMPERLLTRGTLNLVYGTVKVEVTNIDKFAKEHNLWPTLIKIDVEGFENEVLSGANHAMERLPKLAIELHPGLIERYGSSADEVLAKIKNLPYNFWIQRGDEQTPEPFDMNEPITSKAHVFARPK